LAIDVLGGPVINEAMVNEPGGYQYLEWIELHDGSAETVDLDEYSLTVDNVLVDLPFGITINPDEYLIICRKLTATDNEASFEGTWGDSSGVWGDCEAERMIPTPVVASFKLKNDSGVIQLWQGATLVSELAWNDAVADGVSWERESHQADSIGPSLAPSGSTPGELNSLTPVPHDLALANVTTSTNHGMTTITITVGNRGLWAASEAVVELRQADDSLLLESIDLGDLAAGESVTIVRQYQFPGLRKWLMLHLPDDDRLSDNDFVFYAPGEDYPPVVLTEIMAAPESSHNEWIEIMNVSPEAVEIGTWQIGDRIKLCPIGDSTTIIEPNQRLVLVADHSLFQMTYFEYDGNPVRPHCWAKLNNDFDTVRLVDPFGLEADRFGYERPSEGTFCRGEESYCDQWGPSEESAGSPGVVNKVVFASPSSPVTLTIEPTVFSPDGDGFEDSVVIHLAAPEMDNFELRIYDRQGRVVHDFNPADWRSNSYVWRGGVERGARLPVGMYVVYFNIPGVGSAKEAVVIAR
jgi:hypothetical protein